MGKLLLCGNGINIEFEKKFQMTEFIDLLLDEKKIKKFFYQSGNSFIHKFSKIEYFNDFSSFNVSNYQKKNENFFWILKKCRKEIIASKKNLSKDGVESIFKQLFEKVEEYLAFDENEKISYDQFEKNLKELFFMYIWQLQNINLNSIIMKLNSLYPNFKNKLEDYMKIITLNYDLILEKITPKNSRDIIHWHGAIKEKEDGSLDFSKCLLYSLRKPKSMQSFKQIPLFKNYQKYKNKFQLDILGLNPINDESVFALFINSQICNKINFYYFNINDLKNLIIILKKIQYFWLEINKSNKISLIKLTDSKRFDFVKKNEQKYLIKFYQKEINLESQESEFIEINLLSSKLFWDECKHVSWEHFCFYEEIFQE